MVTYHHICLAPLKIPYGKAAVLFEEGEEGLHHIIHPFRLNKSIERMSRTVSVPQGESTVICPALYPVHLLVGTVIGAVHITVNGRSNHRMI